MNYIEVTIYLVWHHRVQKSSVIIVPSKTQSMITVWRNLVKKKALHFIYDSDIKYRASCIHSSLLIGIQRYFIMQFQAIAYNSQIKPYFFFFRFFLLHISGLKSFDPYYSSIAVIKTPYLKFTHLIISSLEMWKSQNEKNQMWPKIQLVVFDVSLSDIKPQRQGWACLGWAPILLPCDKQRNKLSSLSSRDSFK